MANISLSTAGCKNGESMAGDSLDPESGRLSGVRDFRTVGGSRSSRFACAVMFFALLLPVARLAAQGSNMLDVTSGVTPSISFTQKYADVVVNDPDNGPTQVSTGDFSLTIVATLAGVDLTSIDETTAVSVVCGGLNDSHVLGDDPYYKPGDHSATFIIPGDPADPNDPNSPPTVAGSVTYAWTNTALTIKAVGKNIAAGSVADANTYDDGPISDSTDATIGFGDGAGTHPVLIAGDRHSTDKTVGTGDAAQVFTLVTATITGTGDYSGPKLKLAALPSVVNSSDVDVSITSDGVNVSVALNDGDPLPLTADPVTGKWLVTLTLQPGANHLEVLADDGGSGLSAAGANIFYKLPTTIRILTSGLGVVTPALSGSTSHPVGTVLTVTATPGVDQVFAGWSGDVSSPSATLTFTVTENMSLTANFKPSPFLALKGAYAASFSGTPAGILRLSLTKTGAFTGQVLIGGRAYPVLGRFLPDGTSHLLIATDDFHPNLIMDLAFDFTGGSNALTGKVQYYGSTTTPSIFTASAPAGLPPAGLAGAWTVVLRSADSDFLKVPGYATMTVTSAGAATLTGRVTDGVGFQTLSFSGQIGSDALLHLYAPLYPATDHVHFGALSGDLTFASGCSGTLSLRAESDATSKVAGPVSTVFLNRTVTLTGSHYTVPRPGAVTLAIASETTPLTITRAAVLKASGVATVANGSTGAATLLLNPKTGWISGNFTHPVLGSLTPYAGVFETSAGTAAGSYLRSRVLPGAGGVPTIDYGHVTLTPAP